MREIKDLPHAVERREELENRLGGKRPAVFLDYDGTLTPIVDRPEDAVIYGEMREVVRSLARRCPVCVVSGRDRKVVQELMGLDDLIVAGSHGFDIWSPDEGNIEHDAGAGNEDLLEEVKARLEDETETFEGVSVEPKKASVAVHCRLASKEDGDRVKELVDGILADHPDELKVTPGKMVYEIQPNIDWDKGKAVLYLLEALDLDGPDVVPIYVGDDVTDEDAFQAISGIGLGVYVGELDDPETSDRTTHADYALTDVEEVKTFLDGLAR